MFLKISQIHPIDGDELPRAVHKSIKLQELPKLMNQPVNLCVIVYDVDSPRDISCRNGTQCIKQRLLVVDDTMKAVPVDLWTTNVGRLTEESREVA